MAVALKATYFKLDGQTPPKLNESSRYASC